MLGSAESVLRLEIVELVLRDNLDDGKRLGLLVADNRNGQFGALDVGFHQQLVIGFEYLGDSLLEFRFIEHDMQIVFNYADVISVLQEGDMIATGTPDEIRQNQFVQEAYLGGGSK